MLMLSCLGMAACILIYISIMKRVSEKRRKKIKLLQLQSRQCHHHEIAQYRL